VDFGDRVTAGQELALVDTASYEALARQAAANLAKAEATLENARKTLQRVTQLQEQQISSTSDLDAATAAEAEARAQVKAAEATRAIADLNLSRSRVRAPFAAGVAERVVSAGDFVKVGAALFRLVDDKELKLVVQAPERYAGRVRIGQEVKFRVDAWPGEEFTGKVFLVSPSVNSATRTFGVAARVPNEPGRLKANTFASGRIILQQQVATPVVPVEAVVSFAGVTKVYVISNNVASLREVKTGRVHGSNQEILDGLRQGEQVATSGTTRLYDGATVRLKDAAVKTSAQARP
jgi:RND family efflux transporter MFP subunit